MDTDTELQQIERARYEIDSHRDGDYTPEWVEYCRMQIGAAESARARAVEHLGSC